MFGGSKESNSKQNSNNSKGALNSVVKGTEVQGDIVSESDIRVDGTLIGSLDCSGKLIIGKPGTIEGEVKCRDAVVQGKFEGTLVVEQILNVKENAEINGHIKTEKLIVESGAVFNVHCQMGGKSFGSTPSGNQTSQKKKKEEKAPA